MTFWILFPLVAFLANFHLLSYLNWQKRKDAVNRSCSLFIHFLLFYIIHDSIFFWFPLPDAFIIPFLRSGVFIYAPLPYILLKFVYNVIDRKKDAIYHVSFFLIFIFILPGITTELFFKGYVHASWGRAALPGILHLIYGLTMCCIVVYSISLLFRTMRQTSDSTQRAITKTLFIGFMITIPVAVITNIIMPNIFSLYTTFPLASSSSIFFTLAIYPAIRRHNFLLGDYKLLEHTFRFMFEQVDSGIILLDTDQNILQINPTAQVIFERGEKSPKGRSITDLIVEYDPASSYQNNELNLVINGTEKTIVLTQIDFTRPRLDIATILFVQDITERKKIGRVLEEAEEKWRALVEHVPDVILTVDASGVIHFVNHSITGISVEQITGRTIFDFAEDEFHDRIKEVINRVFTEGVADWFEARRIVPDGSHQWFEVHAGPIKQDEKVTSVTLIATDITQRKKTEQEITTLNENLEQLVDERTEKLRESEEKLRQTEKMEAIGQLAGGIAHDFNNQLTGILSCAELLRTYLAEDKEHNDLATTIVHAARQASHLTSQLLTFARKGAYQSIPVNIHEVITEVISFLEHSMDKQIRIKKKCNADHPVVLGDPEQYQNTLLNLAINARDAMPDGGDIVFFTRIKSLTEADCRKEALAVQPGRYLLIGVSDTGDGMDPDVQARIFEPFFTTKEPGKGTGMGLAAVYGTVKTHNGAITVQSKPGSGSVFTLYFPLLEKKEPVPAQKQTSLISVTGKARILVVDDEDIVRTTLAKILKKLGYKVYTCKNGREAVRYYKKSWEEVDMVLLDMIMPKMGGKEAFLAMKKINPKVKALLISGYSITRETQPLFKQGVRGFIQKPYAVGELSQKIAEVLLSK